MLVPKPESGFSKVVEFRSNEFHEPSFLSQTIDARCANHVGPSRQRGPDSIAVVHQQRLRPECHGQHDGLALASMQTDCRSRSTSDTFAIFCTKSHESIAS